jgi:hypothetical protein
VLRNAVTDNARVDIVNIMTFDYFDGASHEMANDTETAAAGLVSQLQSLFPGKTTAQLWAMVGVTEMPGVDDFGPAETFTTADATTVENWAVTKGISSLSFWALQRDNGNCAGASTASDSCSSIAQTTWQFSHTFAPFSGGTTTTPPPPANDFGVSVTPASASVAAGSSASATVGTSVTSGSAQSVSLSATGAPTGATVSFTPASVTAGASSTVKVTTSASTPAGTFAITVQGTGASGSHSATFTVTVTGGTTPPPSGAVSNGGFESGSLSPWTGQPGDAVVSTPVHTGTHAISIAATDSQTGEIDQTVTLAPNSTHTLTAWVRGNFAFIGVSGGASASTWTTSAGYTQLSVPFTTGANGTVTVFVHGWFAQGTVFADDVSLS